MNQLHVGPECLQNGYKVLSVKDSIINEGCHIGIPSTFITLAVGNEAEAKIMTVEQILALIKYTTITINGVEPATQDLTTLAILIKQKFPESHLRVETHGKFPIFDAIMNEQGEIVSYMIDWIVATPLRENNYKVHTACNVRELKYICDRDFTLDVIPEDFKNRTIWLHPVDRKSIDIVRKVQDLVLNNAYVRLGIKFKIY